MWRPFLTKEEKSHIAKIIAQAEAQTTGEIHVHIMGRARGRDMLSLAPQKFKELGLDKTLRRNGVLILISDLDHRFVIWGDEGIHAKAGQPLWENAKKTLISYFSDRRYTQGIEACVREVGRELAAHFPKTDPGPGANELPDEITES